MSMIRLTGFVVTLFIGAIMSSQEGAVLSQTEPAAVLQNGIGLRLFALRDAGQPMLRAVLPGHTITDRTIEILVPEHVTALKHGSTEAEHLFLPRAGSPLDRTEWRSDGQTLEYKRRLPDSIDMSVRATLEEDGIRFQYEFTNQSSTSYDMIYAVTDPRLTGILHDVRMERTYVHHSNGFDLLASDVPVRLTLPLDRWLPCRILASFTWPVPAQRVEKRGDGITYYNKARAVDIPLIVTQSSDKEWVVASFSRAPGNVWSNPELTCQHVDPQASLSPQQRILLVVKMLVIRGTLEDALRTAVRQRGSLK
jgi:hypothetical protein